MAVQSGDGNNFPQGQCTWWADERYHQLAGYYVPWNHTGEANAYQWLAQAESFGWNTASSPPKKIPSIICLQGSAGQGVESSLGHVAVVERINSDGTVLTSGMNWRVGPLFSTDLNTGGYLVRQVTFKTGPGVSFIWAGGGTLSNSGSSNGGNGGDSGSSSATYVPILEQVHETLVNVPGFYGIALALDEVEQFPGWINLSDPNVQWDVVGWIRSVGATIGDNFAPAAVRGILISLGLFILIVLIMKVVLEVGEKAMPIISAIAA
jgi:surface antigen